MLKKIIYYNLEELDLEYGIPVVASPFRITGSLTEYLDETLGEGKYPSLNTDITDTNVIKLWKSFISKYYYHAVVKMSLCNFSTEYLESEEYHNLVFEEYKKWIYKMLSLLDETSTYYLPLLKYYNDSANHLMDDIKATSKNKVKFNDTPQNPNSAQVYEGDDYITHFTSTEGENSSPLMSKMMRLKEIQENYRDLMSQWVKDFERIYYQEDC